MSLLYKVLVVVGSIVVIGMLGFTVYKQIENANRQAAIEQSVVEQKQLIDGIVRSQSQWTTKDDLSKFITDSGVNLQAIRDDLDKLHAEVYAVNVIVSSSTGQQTTDIPTVNPGPNNPNPVDPNNPDPFGYMKAQQNLFLTENFATVKIPMGSVGFSAWKENPWSLDIKGRDYQVATVMGLDANQRSYVYNKFTLKVDGKDYDLPIRTAETRQVYPTAQWSWWNPRLFMTTGGSVDVSSVPIKGSANLGGTLGLMSYGKFKPTPTISVLQLGAVYQTGTQKAAGIVNPVNFNIGGILPSGLMDNTYLGPSIQLDTNGNAFIGINASVGF